jgi:hypothetical protein
MLDDRRPQSLILRVNCLTYCNSLLCIFCCRMAMMLMQQVGESKAGPRR